MSDKPMYDQWIARRRDVKPSRDMTDQVMAALEQPMVHRQRHVRLADRMNQSWLARWAACLAAVVVGSLPFLLVAYVAQMLAF